LRFYGLVLRLVSMLIGDVTIGVMIEVNLGVSVLGLVEMVHFPGLSVNLRHVLNKVAVLVVESWLSVMLIGSVLMGSA